MTRLRDRIHLRRKEEEEKMKDGKVNLIVGEEEEEIRTHMKLGLPCPSHPPSRTILEKKAVSVHPHRLQ